MIGSRAFALLISALGLIGLAWSMGVRVSWIPTVPDSTPGTPATMTAVSGMGQSEAVGYELTDAIVVRITDDSGTPVPDVPVTFTVTDGGGTLFIPATATNLDGEAATRWTLGPSVARDHRAEARAVVPESGLALAVEFLATVRAAAPQSLRIVHGDDQMGIAGDPLPDALAVLVADRYGNPVSGAVVSWEVSHGGGHVSTAEGVTDALGVARTVWTPGPEGPGQSVVARASGLSPANFYSSAYATHGVVFSDSFDRGLGQWIGRPGSGHHAEVVWDPIDPTNRVVRFTRPVAAGDLFSVEVLVDPSATYVLNFDYLGLTTPGSARDNTGGFIGLSAGVPGVHTWLAGTEPWQDAIPLVDDRAWHSYSITLVPGRRLSSSNDRIRIMLEDAEVTGGVAEDAYFDNIELIRIPPQR